MKLVHKNDDPTSEMESWLEKAKYWEKEGEFDKATSAFERVIKDDPLQEYAYNRLMIIFRKQKEYKKERAIITTAIKAFEEKNKRTSSRPHNRRVKTLSTAIAKAMGLTDKKGKAVYEPEPIGRWRKRMALVKKKLTA